MIGNDIVTVLDHSASNPEVVAAMRTMKLRMPKTYDKFYDADIVWNVKHSLRFDMYRRDRFIHITGTQPRSEGEWIFGSVDFMGAGYDDRVKAGYAGQLPFGLALGASPERCIEVLGPPQLDDRFGRHDDRVLAWVEGHLNISIIFSSKDGGMRCYTQGIRGTQETWGRTWPDVFRAL